MDELDIVRRIIEFIEEASPIMWELSQKQVMVNVLGNIVWGLLFVGIAILMIKAAKWFWAESKKKGYEEGLWQFYTVIVTTSLVIVGLFGLSLLLSGLGWAMNPDYWAVKVMIGLIP